MSTEICKKTNPNELMAALVNELLRADIPADEIIFVMAVAATEFALQSAPTPEHAFEVILAGVMGVIHERCSHHSKSNSDSDSLEDDQAADETVNDRTDSLPTSRSLH